MSPQQWIGCRVRHDILNHIGLVIISEGTVLTEGHIELIEKHHLFMTDNDLDMPMNQWSRGPANEEKLVSKATEEIESIFHSVRSTGKVPVQEINETVLPSIHQVTDNPNLFDILSGIQAKDDYTYRHNIGVGVISTMIGKWLGLKGDELSLLTLAATLHDVGKVKIEDDILNKPGKFTDEEYALMKKHTTFGYDILKNMKDIPERVAIVALQHHEREDGRGYPYGVKGDSLDFFSKIVAVADIFHAMTSKRVYKDAAPFYKVMQEMVSEGFGCLEPRIVNLFVERMMQLSIGGRAVLTDNREATIVMVYPDDPINPLVMVGDSYIDLRQKPGLHLFKLTE